MVDFRILIVPGLHGSGPDHWQSRWQQLHPSFERVEQEQWDVPHLDAWSARVADALRASFRPTLIVAHSFGCLATVHCAALETANLAGTLLVAPADPYKFDVAERLRHIALPRPSIMIGSLDDPWMDSHRAADWAELWDAEFVNAGALGHINAESGLGDWSFGMSQLHRLAAAARVVRPLALQHKSRSR